MNIATPPEVQFNHPAPYMLPKTKALKAMHTIIRDKGAPHDVFVHTSRRIMRLLLEYAVDFLPHDNKTVETPSGGRYKGYEPALPVCGVSVLRAGDSMESELRAILPSAPIGKILIQRDKQTHKPKFFFANLPQDISDRFVLLLDPMLATGGTAVEALSTLQTHGVPQKNIIFVTLLSVADGLRRVHSAFPEVRVVTSSIEERLNDKALMVPGIGDFGDRYFGTSVSPAAMS